jgi:uncharacterized protein YprB with RNaseH-like and TPR domain
MINFRTLKKDELLDRLGFRCIHRHNGLSHPECYEQDRKKGERIGYLDIESSGLQADFAIVLSYCIKEQDGKILSRVITDKEMKDGTFDRDLLKQCVEDMRRFDRLVYHYGDKFDIPVLRTRCVYWGLDFPLQKEIKGTDTYPILKYKFKLHSNRLESACTFFNIPSKGHRLEPNIWIKALSGDKKSLDYILTHNKEDVIALEELYKLINKHAVPTAKSI